MARVWSPVLPRVDAALPSIKRLGGLLWTQRQHWLEYQERLRGAVRACGVEDQAILDAIIALNLGNAPQEQGLDRAYWESLKQTGMVSGAFRDSVYTDEATFAGAITEVPDAFAQILTLVLGDDTEARIIFASISPASLVIFGILSSIAAGRRTVRWVEP